jgi:hypothetical protein
VIIAAVSVGPGATLVATRRVAPQPAAINAAVRTTLTANVLIDFLLTTRAKNESTDDAAFALAVADTAQATVIARQ